MPSLQRNKNRSKGTARDKAAIGGLAFSLLCGLGFLANSTSVEDLQLLLHTDSLQRSLSAENSNLLYLRTGEDGAHLGANHGKYEPVHCPQLLEMARAQGNEQLDPNKGILYGKQIEIDPKFWISLHNKETDVTRWHVMELGHYYERALTQVFIEVLREAPPGSRVLDVGGNIGFFTLLSAANGPVAIDTFEPNKINRLRLCESLALNHWHSEFDKDCTADSKQVSMVNLYPLGVGRKEAIMSFAEHTTNPGQGVFKEQAPRPHGTGLQVITLDNFARERGWFQTRPNIAILKVDVEGMEYTVIEGALELLRAKIVQNVFMEVSAREILELEVNKPCLRLLKENGYKLHKYGGWRGPTKEIDFPQDDGNIAEHIMLRAASEASKQLNLWWKLAT